MTAEAALLKAIAREPHEDHHRLVYADWLDEHGDPARAELIRLQCAFEQDRDWETGEKIAGGARQYELRVREWDLQRALLRPPGAGERPALRELTPEIAEVVAVDPNRVTFRRGMIRDLYLCGRTTSSVPGAFRRQASVTALPPGLHVGRDLDISCNPITSLPPGLCVGRSLNAAYSPLTSLPHDLLVGGSLNLRGTLITALPPGLHVGGDLYLDDTRVASLPSGLCVGRDLYLQDTPITSLPRDLRVGGNLFLDGVRIREGAARDILTMPGLSNWARATGLDTAGFGALAQEARRRARAETGHAAPPLL